MSPLGQPAGQGGVRSSSTGLYHKHPHSTSRHEADCVRWRMSLMTMITQPYSLLITSLYLI